MSRIQFLFVFLLFSLIACNALSGASSTQKALVTEGIMPAWTSTPAPTKTITPSSTPTATHTPTNTPDLMETALQATETGAVLNLVQLQEQALLVCQGQGAPEADEYSASLNEANPFVFCLPSANPAMCEMPSQVFGAINPDISKLDPKDIRELQLVICMDSKESVVQTCTYRLGTNSAPIQARRVQMTYHYTVFSARAGSKVATVSLTGGFPPPCPDTVTVFNNVAPIFGGAFPAVADIYKKLYRYFHLPIE